MSRKKSLGVRVLELLLSGDEAGLTALVQRTSDRIYGRVECPECGDRGPHDSNVSRGEETWCCEKCGTHFELEDED